MDKIITYIIALFAVIAVVTAGYFVLVAPPVTPTTSSTNASVVYYFYGQGCPHCAKIEPFMENMTREYPDVDIQMLEVWYNQTNQKIYTQVNEEAGISSPPGVPEVVIGKTVLVGEVDIPVKLEAYLQAIEKKK